MATPSRSARASASCRTNPSPTTSTHEVNHVATRLLELKGIPDAEAAVEKPSPPARPTRSSASSSGAQGGDADALEDLPVSAEVNEVTAPRDGYVARFEASGIGSAALALGAGRAKKGDKIDPGAGIEVLVKAGDASKRASP